MKIKNRPPNEGKGLICLPDKVEITNFDHPVFCFKYLHREYDLNCCTDTEKKSLIEQLTILSMRTWKELQLAGRHGLGSEKISVSSIKPSLPSFLTEEVEYLLAFRFDGLKPFVGYRNKFIFHIFFIDRAFTLYNH